MWILFATLNPLAEGFRSMFIKKASRDYDPIIIAWFNNILPLLVFIPLLFFVPITFNRDYLLSLTATSLINVAATILYMHSISHDDISKVMPMLSFTPLFLLFIEPLILGEKPGIFGVFGVVLVVIGSYLLNLGNNGASLLTPFKELFINKGTRLMFLVAVLWSVSANFDKICINNASVYQHIIFMNGFIFICVTIIVLIFKRDKIPQLKLQTTRSLFNVSIFTVGTFIFHMAALSMTLVVYVVAMKRMSGVFSVLIGAGFLKEKNWKERLLGSVVMFIGVLFIVFFE